MKERVLVAFMEGRASPAELAADLADAYQTQSEDCLALVVEFAADRHVVTKAMMLRVCDAVLDGRLLPALLEPIGDCLMLSETFEFDEPDRELLADVAHYWGSPEICYPLDVEHVAAFREWLESGTDPLS